MARVLVACEFSGRVRDAFLARGHDAISCDLLPTEVLGPHIQGDVFDVLETFKGDLLVAFPPCTHLASSGARWFKEKMFEQRCAVIACLRVMTASFEHIAMENPIGVLSTQYRKPDQIIQPWQFGHGETKATCLWLKNLPKLVPTNIVEGRTARVHREPPGPDRWKNRSRTYQGIADAMADQWGKLLSEQTRRAAGSVLEPNVTGMNEFSDVLAWLGRWRDTLPPEAVSALQDICNVPGKESEADSVPNGSNTDTAPTSQEK